MPAQDPSRAGAGPGDTAIRGRLDRSGRSEAWEAAARLAPVGLAQADAAGRCVAVNQRWCELTSRPAAGFLGQPWSAAIHPGDAATAWQCWAAARSYGESGFDCRLVLPGGTKHWARATLVALPPGQSGPAVLVTLTDISASAQAATKLRQQVAAERQDRQSAERAQLRLADHNALLRESAQQRIKVLAAVSDELRTPLTSIVAFAELVKGGQENLSSDSEAYLDVIQRNAARLTQLIGDLLLLSRLEAGVAALDLAPVSLPEIVQEAALAAAARSGGRAVDLDVQAGEGPLLHADARRLAQLVDNLLSNAVKFTPDGGQVRAAASCDGDRWLIEVTDTGIGIPPGELDQVFDRFFRGSNARAAALPGTGLGLSVVKIITELHGGQAAVESVLKRGTTLRVSLPLRT